MLIRIQGSRVKCRFGSKSLYFWANVTGSGHKRLFLNIVNILQCRNDIKCNNLIVIFISLVFLFRRVVLIRNVSGKVFRIFCHLMQLLSAFVSDFCILFLMFRILRSGGKIYTDPQHLCFLINKFFV